MPARHAPRDEHCCPKQRWTDPGLDANHNGRSNFLDDAAGEDPLDSTARPALELSAGTLTLRYRVNAADVSPVLQASEDLETGWAPVVEGVEVQELTDTLDGYQRTRTYTVLTGPKQFFRVAYP